MSKEPINVVSNFILNDTIAKKIGLSLLVSANMTKSKQMYGFLCEDYLDMLSWHFCQESLSPVDVRDAWSKMNSDDRGNLVSFLVEHQSEKEVVAYV